MNSQRNAAARIGAALLPKYKLILRGYLEAFDAFALDADFGSMANIGHKLKGNAGMFGFPRLADLGAELYSAAEESELARVESAIAKIREHAKRENLA